MPMQHLASMRESLDFLKGEDELLIIRGKVDPICEISGLQKALEGGPALLFNAIKGYPRVRNTGNVFARRERVAKLFGISDHKKLKFRALEAIKKPIPPHPVKKAPCQEVVITQDIDVTGTIPVIKHSEADGARILGGGNVFVGGKYFKGGSELSFKRMHFKGKDWGSIEIGLGSHLWDTCLERRGEKIPATINIGTPPAVNLVAATMFLHPIIPAGSDEIGFAGGIQGFPVDICHAKTVDAYSIANSEWVIEGYIDTAQRLWETEAGQKEGKAGVAPVMPEWTGYLGRDYRGFRFQVTAITYRKDQPIFYTPLAHSLEVDIASAVFREACFYELAERLVPGVVVDVNILSGLAAWGGGVVYQIKKRRGGDEGFQRNILAAALGTAPGLRLAIIVDDDIDIYSAEDVLWAITTRVNPSAGILRGGVGGVGFPMMPTERAGPAMEGRPYFFYEGGMGLDATAPYLVRDTFRRGKYPVDKVDVRKWLTEPEIASVLASQSEYARVLARLGA